MLFNYELSRRSKVAVVFGLFLVIPACSDDDPGPPPEQLPGQAMSGQVLYKGTKVPRGYVFFYHPEKSMESGSLKATPFATAEISNGVYKVEHLPFGHYMVALATDPDIDVGAILMAAQGEEEGAGPPPPPPGGLPPGGLPGGPGGAPGGPNEFERPDKPTGQLSVEQVKMLKAIHKKYGNGMESGLMIVVEKGRNSEDISLD